MTTDHPTQLAFVLATEPNSAPGKPAALSLHPSRYAALRTLNARLFRPLDCTFPAVEQTSIEPVAGRTLFS